jgi:hypothetical protein
VPIEIDPFFCFEPTPIAQAAFREKRAESVWERKVGIHTEESDLLNYLRGIAEKF